MGKRYEGSSEGEIVVKRVNNGHLFALIITRPTDVT